MISVAPCPPTLRSLVREVSPPRRGDAALRLAERFDEGLTPAEADLYDAAVCELVRGEPTPVRARVSRRIARAAAGPVRCVLLFAHDREAAVAAPVLRHSPLVPDPVLVALAWSRGQAHLSAIARRRDLAAPVSDMVLARGAAPVLRALAANDTARLSQDGLERLAHLSRADPGVRAALERRPDMPGELRRELGMPVPDEADPLAEEAVEAAADWLLSLRAVREPRESDVARALREDAMARVAALVAHLAEDELPETVAAFRARALDAMVLILRMGEIGWPLAERILRRRLGASGAIAAQQGAYAGLSRRSAERALKALRFRARVTVVTGAR